MYLFLTGCYLVHTMCQCLLSCLKHNLFSLEEISDDILYHLGSLDILLDSGKKLQKKVRIIITQILSIKIKMNVEIITKLFSESNNNEKVTVPYIMT